MVPPDPIPRLSLATITNCWLGAIDGIQSSSDAFPVGDPGMSKSVPEASKAFRAGITTKKVVFL
jgi:hypothetical protein